MDSFPVDTKHHATLCAFVQTTAFDSALASSVGKTGAAFWELLLQCAGCLDAPEHVPMGGATPGVLYVPR